jgi:hypothetical protein
MQSLENFTINGRVDANSQRFEDICTPYNVTLPEQPPFDLANVALVSNGNCGSTCSIFSTAMVERHNVSVAVFGGKPGTEMEYKGFAGNQVLDWTNLDSEIITAGLKDDPLAPPSLLVSGNMRVNWRTGQHDFLFSLCLREEPADVRRFSAAWSYLEEDTPIAYKSERANLRFPYTADTFSNPQNLWKFVEKRLFKLGQLVN